MILDNLDNLPLFFNLNPRFEQALRFLQQNNLEALAVGKYEIDGDKLFAIIVNDQGNSPEKSLLETHEKYIDIQYVISGTDTMGWKPKFRCSNPNGAYNPDTDAQFFNDKPDTWISVQANTFALFFPEDAHTAMISSGRIHKAIIKVAV